MKSGLYVGEVMHQRFAPRRHRLRYRIFMALLDLRRLDEDLKGRHFLSHNRFNLFSFYDRDHGPDQADHSGTLFRRMSHALKANGLFTEGDGLFLLAMPRVLGFVFNPISLYFVTDADGGVKTVVYEVNNTFGDRHAYIITAGGDGRRIRQTAAKRLHVSPFMETRDMAYDFDLTPPEAHFVLNIRLRSTGDHPDDMLFAGFTAQREEISDRALWRLFFDLPLMTLKVVAGIHWEAFRLVLKGLWLKPKPPTERSSLSVTATDSNHS